MHHQSLVALAGSGLLAVMSLTGASGLHAQTASASRFHADSGVPAALAASQLDVLSHDRALRWATSARALHCGPAPLTERPGIESEFTRPRMAPLEAAFADAAQVKRSVASIRMKRAR